MPTKSQAVAADVAALLRARNPLLWIITREEARVELNLIGAATSAGYVPRTWDIAAGVCGMDGKPISEMGGTEDVAAAFNLIARQARGGDRGVWIMRDLPAWLRDLPGAQPQRQLRNLARLLPTVTRDNAQAIIVLTPSSEVPPELAGHATVIEWPMPDREEIAAILDAAITSLPDGLKESAAPNGTREAAIDAAIGLTGEEAASCYAKSLVQFKRIDPTSVSQEKKRVITRERVLEWYDPLPGGINAVGGLEPLKAWLKARKLAYSPKAREYGLPSPKGILLVGPPGTGKSLTAKAIATYLGNLPLLKVDLGALKSKFVGDSEANLRKVFNVVSAVGRCVVWFDEIEKALAGATQGAADGGVSADALGAILSWMQERQGEAFVVATANDVEQLPPELLRKGRFDEVFFVDLPNADERADILAASLRANGRDRATVDADGGLDLVADLNCEGFTGSEIAAIVPEAMFAAFADGGREVTSGDLAAAAATVVPLSKTAKEKIERLRKWAIGRARSANGIYGDKNAASNNRQIDL